jgi:hypothetical protein
MISRRNFIHAMSWAGAAVLSGISVSAGAPSTAGSSLTGVTHSDPRWNAAAKGVDFCRIDVRSEGQTVDAIGVVRVRPSLNKIRVFQTFDRERTIVRTIEEWQAQTSAVAMINGAQYMADPYYMPCAIVITDGIFKGPRGNKQVRGMLVAEPNRGNVPQADLLDFEYDTFSLENTPYTQGVQHWPILLDRKGKIKVAQTELRANRSVVARDFDGNILFFTTEGTFFTLYQFGLLLKESNLRKDGGFKIHTAMNLDGGDEAKLIVKSSAVSYVTQPFDPDAKQANPLFQWKSRLPGVIGVFPR